MKRFAICSMWMLLAAASVAQANVADFSATFEPAADTRLHAFVRAEVPGSANLHQATACPGDVAVSPANTGGRTDAPLSVRLEVLAYDADKAGAPAVPADEHYEKNPMLPFGPPSGPAPLPLFTTTTTFPAGAEYPLRAPLHLPDLPSLNSPFINHRGTIARVRWAVLDAKGHAVAHGFLPDAFADWRTWERSQLVTLDMRGTPSEASQSDKAHPVIPATEASFRSWQFLSHLVMDIEPDPASPPSSDFLARAKLLGIAIHPATNAPLPVVPLCVGNSRYGWISSEAFGNLPPGKSLSQHGRTPDEFRRRQEQLMGAARIPGDTLGRDTIAFFAATAAFMILFFIGTGIVLIRHFAMRKGEARIRVWIALPVWCVTATFLALFALPLLLDRAPRADMTQWRLSTPGASEMLVVETGRAQSFDRAQVVWRCPANCWFGVRNYVNGGAADIDLAAGTQSLHGGPHKPGVREEAMSMRFEPAREPPFTISPDEDSRHIRFTPDGGIADPFNSILKDWAGADISPPAAPPDRSITAHGDFAAVWLFARGKWYSLGPMKDGESRAPGASMFVSAGPCTIQTPFANLFDMAPFALAVGNIRATAETWLAKISQGPGEAVAERRPNEVSTPAVAIPVGLQVREFMLSLDDAVVVGLRSDDNPPVSLSPQFANRRNPVVTTRIVEVEALP